jgi:hypothetical protein
MTRAELLQAFIDLGKLDIISVPHDSEKLERDFTGMSKYDSQ